MAPAKTNGLDEHGEELLGAWLDSQTRPFDVNIHALSPKRKRNEEFEVEEGLLAGGLRVAYQVQPRAQWDHLRRYKRFNVGSESIRTGQCVLVKHDESQEGENIDTEPQWKAQVLEVRALDTSHVYVRVAWLNRPEDLKGGRQPHHGRHELIVSNQMDVIDAQSVNGTLKVVAFDDQDDDNVAIEDQYFWRQTYNFVTRKYSKLRKICMDQIPSNPDELILQCSHPACREWLHLKCIAERALEVHELVVKAGALSKARAKDAANRRLRATPAAYAHNEKKSVLAEVYVKGEPNGSDGVPALKSELVIIADGKTYAQDIFCLACGEPIED